MDLEYLGSGGSDDGGCPTLLANTMGGYIIQAWKTDQVDTVELPHLLLGFLKPDTFLGAPLADTGRGTFRVTGQPITDPETLGQLDLAANETAIEVPMAKRTYYGALPTN